MHSRIFQLETSPVGELGYITEDDIPDWFMTDIADYISNEVERRHEVEWLAGVLEGAADIKDETITFRSDFRKYFEKKYKTFMKSAANLTNVTETEFAHDNNDIDMELYTLRNSYNDRFGFYVVSRGELYTLDDFIRYRAMHGLGKPWYIGGILDYHC